MHALNVPLTLMLTPGGKKMIEPFAGIGAFMDYFFAGTLVADDGAKQKVSFGSNYNSTAIFSSTLRFFRIFACPF